MSTSHLVKEPTDYCPNRASLLEAMSNGGRHGFDTPFFPARCHYRWYTSTEICMILDRFDAVVFIGDDMLRNVYAAFNMLLRQNFAMGGVKQWALQETDVDGCTCEQQIMESRCVSEMVKSSSEVNGKHAQSYLCNREVPPP